MALYSERDDDTPLGPIDWTRVATAVGLVLVVATVTSLAVTCGLGVGKVAGWWR